MNTQLTVKTIPTVLSGLGLNAGQFEGILALIASANVPPTVVSCFALVTRGIPTL